MASVKNHWFLAAAVSLVLVGCQTITQAPGSDKVHLTKDPADVTACKPVGNIAVPRSPDGTVPIIPINTAELEFRNLAVGFGGNAALVTSGSVTIPTDGIAYHCD